MVTAIPRYSATGELSAIPNSAVELNRHRVPCVIKLRQVGEGTPRW